MTNPQIFALWAGLGLVVTIALVVAARRVEKARGWLVIVGLVMLAGEEPMLTWFWALIGPGGDKDGMSGLITTAAQTHVMDTAILGFGLYVFMGWIAMTAFLRGERWAAKVLAAGWFLTAATLLATSLTLYPRGLFGPGYGWDSLAVGLLAWGCALWLTPARQFVRSGR
ncbi:hypothetical protein [Actinocrispum wychmicini]|uniref:Uncharacterized protein n=1 Tax=Actinocrispum wychmicini TaxID=1213861 RepID=A0A4R2J5B5_9PSEU|nr:hypothetical protein [Actinocrispum wychmicini]TCO53494.1 hypothetical protein EV192_11083 [Actinocrispum wychmicini]